MSRAAYRLAVWMRRLAILLMVLAVIALGPVVWVETACTGPAAAQDFAALLPEAARRDESRTYTTYPEWHIVHAYDDYARVIADGDPHDFGFLAAATGFWTALCPLAETAAAHGGFTGESKLTIYTIGASFTLEMLFKAAYEESLGRIAALIRGAERAPLDALSAEQAARYAAFLQQTPWYKWDFASDAAALTEANRGSFRDLERTVALNIEYRAKALYARAIAAGVAATGTDALTLRSVVTGLDAEALAVVEGVTVIGPAGPGIEIETPRYRAFTAIARTIGKSGGTFAEIAGNDDILVTVLSEAETLPGALYSFPRQGYGDRRHLVEVKVTELTARLAEIEAAGARVEHIHDY